jgi:DNA-binding MarR family transcriptional regulator
MARKRSRPAMGSDPPDELLMALSPLVRSEYRENYLDVKLFDIKYFDRYNTPMADLVDTLLDEWSDQRPEIDCSGLGVVVRVQLLSKLLSESAEEALSGLGVKLWEYDVLSALRRRGAPYEMPASELARDSMLTSGTITTRIDGLKERGLVARRRDPDDRRVVQIRLTNAGLDLIDRAIGTRTASADEQLDCLTPRERANVVAGLRKVLSRLAPGS